jgi:hypothetical protein
MMQRLEDILDLPTTLSLVETAITTTADNDTTVYKAMTNYRQAVIYGIIVAHGGTDTITLTPLQAVNTSGGSAKAIGSDTQTFTVVGCKAVSVLADQLDRANSFDCVGGRLKSSGTASHSGCILIIRGDARFCADTMPS